jgi:hypothetical protein
MYEEVQIGSLPSPRPFGDVELGGMFTVVKIRENPTSCADPGPYQYPPARWPGR